MTVTKRTRFEILRRDNHACQYCGSMAPDVVLHVDHVIPVALGGSDHPSNLVTACRDCNSGKTSTSPSEATVASVSSRSLALAEAFRAALAEEVEAITEQRDFQDAFARSWNNWASNGKPLPLPPSWRETLGQWMKIQVPLEIIQNAIDLAMSKQDVRTSDAKFRYMCGVVWRTLDKAQQAVTSEPAPLPSAGRYHMVPCVNEECPSMAIFEDEDEEETYCSSCENERGWRAGEYYAASMASARDLVAMHIDGQRSGFGERVRWVA